MPARAAQPSPSLGARTNLCVISRCALHCDAHSCRLEQNRYSARRFVSAFLGTSMPRDPRYDILFEPVRIGPVTAKNRFFQVPHCNGMGHAHPHAHAAMRGMKAEGGWAVVSTEECEIHPTSDVSPYRRGAAVGRSRHPVQRADVRGGAQARRAGGGGAQSQRPVGLQLLQPRGADRAGPPDDALLPVPGARHGPRGHPQLPPLAPRGGDPRAQGRVRHRLRLCRARPDAAHELPAAPPQHPHRRIWRQPGEPRAAVPRGDRGYQGRGRRHLRRRGALRDRRDDGAGRHHGGGRGARRGRDAGRAAGPVGRQHQRLEIRFLQLALRGGGLPGEVRRLREDADHQAGGGRRPLHLARYHGLADQARRARHDRRGAAVDRRSVPAEEDRGRAARGHPRMHRLQHLHQRRQHHHADALHPEPDHGRGMAQGLASGGDRRARVGGSRADRRRGAGGAGSGARARASAATRCIWRRRRPSSAAA